jgi:geranylgeranyl pyrophosphate synthase
MSQTMTKAASTIPIFPTGKSLEKIMGLTVNDPGVLELVHKVLTNPVQDFFSHPGKGLRAEAVRLSFALMQGAPPSSELQHDQCTVGGEILELIHAGSLVIDDIEDNSETRRGEPTLHRKYGTPLALNAGNWLYFFPFERISDLKVAPERELRVHQEIQRALLRAHYGQAIDVGFALNTLPQKQVYSVCRATMELKSGALMALALRLGGLLALDQRVEKEEGWRAAEVKLDALGNFGYRFGTALQMLNDVGNLHSTADPEKRKEDLLLKRPSWVWAVAATELPPAQYQIFLQRLEHIGADPQALDDFIAHHGLDKTAKEIAIRELNQAFTELADHFSGQPDTLQDTAELIAKLTRAYE